MTRRAAIATAHWRRLDGVGTDRCTLSRLAGGWMLVGHASWQSADGEDCALDYDLRCAPDWTSLSADVGGRVCGDAIALKLTAAPEGWQLNGIPQADTAGCIDLDLSFTPATNLLPLRRVGLGNGRGISARAAWLVPDLDRIEPLEQAYTPQAADRVRYSSKTFCADLSVHETGFVTRYAGLWDGWVDA